MMGRKRMSEQADRPISCIADGSVEDHICSFRRLLFFSQDLLSPSFSPPSPLPPPYPISFLFLPLDTSLIIPFPLPRSFSLSLLPFPSHPFPPHPHPFPSPSHLRIPHLYELFLPLSILICSPFLLFPPLPSNHFSLSSPPPRIPLSIIPIYIYFLLYFPLFPPSNPLPNSGTSRRSRRY